MRKKPLILMIWLVVSVSGGLLPAVENESGLKRFEVADERMGTRVAVTLYATSRELALQAAERALDRVAELDQRLSDYRSTSELMQLCRTAGEGPWVNASDDLWRVVAASERYFRASDGAFDITVGPAVRLWRVARKTGVLPPESEIARARQAMGFEHVRLDAGQRRIQLVRPGMQLDLGGIAKGYAADEALAALKQCGIERALVDLGGDMAIGAPPPGKTGWTVAIAGLNAAPVGSRQLVAANCGVATSGDTYQYVVIDGVRYSHLIDPRTGRALALPTRATVIASDATTADALASVLSVAGADAGAPILQQFAGVAAEIAWLPRADPVKSDVAQWSNAAWKAATKAGGH